MSKPIHIDWIAKNALDGTMQLGPWEELAYRRILDMIYASDDNLLDDDESLRWSTKTGTKWTKIKQRLIAMKKIEVVDGRITNAVCREKLSEAHGRIESARNAGYASAEARKSSKNKDTTSTDVATSAATDGQPITNYQSSEDKSSSESVTRDFEEFWSGWKPFEMPKGSRQEAEQRYRQARKRASHATIIAARDGYLAECHRLRSKTKHACVWLNKGGFAESYDAPASAIESSGEVIRTIDREEYERAKRLIATAPNRKGFQSVIDAYEKQNPQAGTPVAPLHRHVVTSTPDARG